MARVKAAKKKAPKKKKASKKDSTPRMKGLGAVAKRMEAWKPASEALTSVRSVETIFPQLNVATGINGWPLQRVGVVHGPSAEGKTTFIHGLGMSFLERKHFYGFVDAEYTTPEEWVTLLMQKWASSPAFLAMRPHTYEETVNAVRQFVEVIAAARAAKEIPQQTSALLAIDSIRKLVPKRLREMIEKEGAEAAKGGGIDGMSGRAAQYKAALNAAWLDELVPLLYHTNTTMVFIGRESQKQKETKYDVDWKLTGGGALFFDSSLVARITRVAWLKSSSAKDAPVVGERHRVRIYKSKVAGKEGKVTDCYFHTSNGVMMPAGFDRGRDVLEMARQTGVITQNGSHLMSTLTGETWNGETKAVKALHADPGHVEDLYQRCKLTFMPEERDLVEGEEVPGDNIDLFQKANG